MSAQQPINNQPDMTQVDVMPTDTTQVTTETPAVVETTSEVPTQEVAQTVMNTEAETAGVTPEQQTQLDNTVVNQMSDAIASDQVTAEDIMVAILTDTLGVSPGAAQSLCRMFVQDMADKAIENSQTQVVEPTQPTNDVPPQVM